MSGETTGSEILDQYRNTSSKLKKRFLRKPNRPNVTEACESFVSLGQNCERQELPSYAGLCWIAAARCEGSLGNIPGETSCLIRAARQFLNAEETDFNIGCSSVSTENIQAGLSCFTHASSRFDENCSNRIGLDLEIAQFLKRINRLEYVKNYLDSAVELSQGRSDTKIYCLKELATHLIDCGDYVGALESFREISNSLENLPKNGSRSEILLKCEINSVFLLLILRPSPQKLSPALAKILEKYTWGDKNDPSIKACRMTEKMFLLIQSLVMICQSLDTSTLAELEGEFWPLLSREEKDLLRILVRMYS